MVNKSSQFLAPKVSGLGTLGGCGGWWRWFGATGVELEMETGSQGGGVRAGGRVMKLWQELRMLGAEG